MNKNELKGLIQTNVQGRVTGGALQSTLKAMNYAEGGQSSGPSVIFYKT